MMRRLLFLFLLVVSGTAAAIVGVPELRLTALGWFGGDPVEAGRPVRYWVYLFQTGEPGERRQAAKAFAALGDRARPALDELFASGVHRLETVQIMKEAGLDFGAALPTIFFEFDTASPEDLPVWGDLLSSMPDEQIAGEMLRRANSPDTPLAVRREAFRVVGRMRGDLPDRVPALLRILRTGDRHGPDRWVIDASRETIVAIGKPGVPPLIELLADEDRQLRVWAMEALLKIGPDAKPAEHELAEAMRRELLLQDRALAAAALWAVSGVRDGTEVLVESLDEEAPYAVQALGQMGGPVVKQLLNRLRGAPLAWTRRQAAEVFGRMTPTPQGAVKPLTVALDDVSEEVQSAAAQALGKMGAVAAFAAPRLIARLGDVSQEHRREAAEALGRIGLADGVVQPLTRALLDESPEVRAAAADALARLGKGAESAVETLQIARQLARPGDRVYLASSAALWFAAGKPEALLELLGEADRASRVYAVETIARVGPGIDWDVPVLAKAMEREEDDVARLRMAQVLGDRGSTASAAVPAFTRTISRLGRWSGPGDDLTEQLARIDPDAAASLGRPPYLRYATIAGVLILLLLIWRFRPRRRRRVIPATVDTTPQARLDFFESLERTSGNPKE
jgi:HEAT repeat protein